jgi:hypothetical protein
LARPERRLPSRAPHSPLKQTPLCTAELLTHHDRNLHSWGLGLWVFTKLITRIVAA